MPTSIELIIMCIPCIIIDNSSQTIDHAQILGIYKILSPDERCAGLSAREDAPK